MFHFASIWMFGNLPEGEILEQNKMVVNIITSMVDSRVFFLLFFPQKLGAITKMFIWQRMKNNNNNNPLK